MTSALSAEDARFEAWLMRETGMDAASLGPGALARAVRERMRHRGEPSAKGTDREINAYWNLLNTSPDERQALIETLVVPETWFFRDSEAFAALASLANARLAREPARPMHILSAPCSTGEEPYTIAMALLDAGIDAACFSIDAVDISACAIARAQEAVYGRNSFRGAATEFRGRHFTETPNGWVLRERARAPVRFAQTNLFDLPVMTDAHYDFIFCRNVLIYFDQDAQDRAIHLLKAQLAQDGTLFVGSAETGLMMRHAFTSARIPLAFAFHHARPELTEKASAVPHRKKTPVPKPLPSRPLPASRGTPGTKKPARDGSPTTLDNARRLADTGRLGDAEHAVRQYTLEHGPDAEAFYLLGLIADARGLGDEARDFYRKALYLDPDHYEALAQLAMLIEAAGDATGAARMTARAQRVLVRRDAAGQDGGNTHGEAHDPRRTR